MPPDLTCRAVGLLTDDRYVFNLVALPELAHNPDGDAVECDILAGAANAVLRGLRELELGRRGSIVIEPVEMAFSGVAAEVEQHQLGALAHAPVWEEVEARIRSEGTPMGRVSTCRYPRGLLRGVRGQSVAGCELRR